MRASVSQRQWTEAQIATLLSPSRPSSSSAAPGGSASSSSTSPPALMSPSTPQPQPEGHLLGHSLLPSPAMVCAFSRTTRLSRWSISPAMRSLLSPPTLEGASLTPKQVHAFCYHLELLIRVRVYDAQTFTLLTDPKSIIAIGLHFMTSNVPDLKTSWEISTILEALRECYPAAPQQIRCRCSSANS